MFALAVDAPNADMVIAYHGWLYKFKYWDINTDQMILTSVATGNEVYIDLTTFKLGYFKELADAHESA
jgi:hypothetical protein